MKFRLTCCLFLENLPSACSISSTEVSYSNLFPLYFFPKARLPASANEYVDCYENRHRIRKKSVYHRKYHILNVMYDIAQKNNIRHGYYCIKNILRIFALIDQVSPDINIGGK